MTNHMHSVSSLGLSGRHNIYRLFRPVSIYFVHFSETPKALDDKIVIFPKSNVTRVSVYISQQIGINNAQQVFHAWEGYRKASLQAEILCKIRIFAKISHEMFILSIKSVPKNKISYIQIPETFKISWGKALVRNS